MTLQEMIAAALGASGPGGASVTADEGQAILSRGIMLGASAEDLSAMSGIPVAEINNFIQAMGLQGNLADPGSAEDTYTPPASDPPPVVTTDETQTPPPVIGTTPQTTPPPQTTTPPPQTTQAPQNNYTPPVIPPLSLSPIENLGNVFANNFGNNPGALGFADLNPLVTSAENTQQTAIPEFLKPFLANSVDASQGAMQGLTELLARDHATTSPYNAQQEAAQQMALDVAGGAGGFLPQAQSALSEIANSDDIVSVFNQGSGLLTDPMGLSNLQNLGDPLNQTAQNTLEQTASGDFLYGNPGFDAAVQASIAQAMPHINSNFALQGGAGALSGGLNDAAIAEVAANSFAREFGNERNRQIGAAGQLNNFGLARNDQQIGAANSMIGANQNAGSVLTGIANADRGRQLVAATQLPQIGLLGSQIVGGVGDARQAQEERTKLGQIQAMQQLLSSSFGNINPNSLFGNINSVQSNSNTAGGILGGAMTGAKIGGMFGGPGAAIGAIGGGLLGGFG